MTSALLAFEEHGEVLPYWHEKGLSGATVVVFDRHLDIKGISEHRLRRLREAADSDAIEALRRDAPLRDDDSIAYGSDDFLSAAGQLGLVRRVIWVLPSASGASPRALGVALWESLSFIPEYGHQVLDTFAVDNACAHAQVGPLDVAATTVEFIGTVELPSSVEIDFDLDYFAGPASILGALVGLKGAISGLLQPELNVTAAFSIHSGHLPSDRRWIGDALAATLGRPLVIAGARLPIAHRPGGASEAALRALRLGDVPAAERHCDAARAGGERATCAAYELAIHHLRRRDYAAASRRLRDVMWEFADTVQGHALVLDALCAVRCGDYERGLQLARRCIDGLPLREEGYVLASCCVNALGHGELTASYERRRAEVVAVREGIR